MSKKKSNIILLFATVLSVCLLVISGIFIYDHYSDDMFYPVSDKNDQNHLSSNAMADDIQMSEDEIMKSATHIVDAVYKGQYETPYITQLIFEPSNTMKGTFKKSDEKQIYVSIPENTPSPFFVKDQIYFLCLEKHVSVYWETDQYILMDDLIISEKDSRWGEFHEKAIRITSATKDSTPDYYGIPFSTSTDIGELIAFSGNIYVVRIDGIEATSTINPTTLYDATILKIVKGGRESKAQILLTLFNDTVEVGKEYVVLLADSSNIETIYTLSAKENCVYSMTDSKLPAELAELVQKATDYDSQK